MNVWIDIFHLKILDIIDLINILFGFLNENEDDYYEDFVEKELKEITKILENEI